jgi:CDP-glucose 4,6-dehydratase
MDFSVFSQKKILITGHTGFKGSWLFCFLKTLGAEVHGISLPPVANGIFNSLGIQSEENNHYIDILNREAFNTAVLRINPDICFHLAAQPLVQNSFLYPMQTYFTNIVGTLNLFDSLSKCENNKVIVTTTTDKVYKENSFGIPHKESDPLGGGIDPYSTSKSAVEMIIKSWREVCKSNGSNVKVISVRSGNVLGGGDVSKNRLMPDLISAFKNNIICNIRNPNHIRPWQHVLDPIFGYILVAKNALVSPEISGEFNFGPPGSNKITVGEVADIACSLWGSNQKWVHHSETKSMAVETTDLTVNSDRAHSELNWYPKLNLEESIKWTVDWEKTSNQYNSKEITQRQIQNYLGLL